MLLLIISVAVAAVILTGKQFAKNELLPKASNSDYAVCSEAELNEIKDIAEKNGITITKEIQRYLHSTDQVYKEDLIRAFWQMDFGRYIGALPVAEQAAYENLMVKIGLIPVRTRVTPSGDEISEEQALQIMQQYAKSSWNINTSAAWLSKYERFLEYRQMTDENGDFLPRRRYAHFETNNLKDDSYDFVLDSNDEIMEARQSPGVHSSGDLRSLEAIFDYYQRQYGWHYEYSQAVWEQLVEDLRACNEKYGKKSNVSVQMTKQKYGRPSEDDISEKTAVEKVYHSAANEKKTPAVQLKLKYNANALYLIGKTGSFWKVSLADTNPGNGRSYDLMSVEINAATGEVENVWHFEPEKISGMRRISC